MARVRRGWRSVTVLLVLGVAGLSGCGGGTSKADFVKEADAACRPTDATLTGVTKPNDLTQLASESGKLATANDQQVAAVRRLDMPSGEDKTRAERILTDLGAVTGLARTVETKARANDLTAAPVITETRTKAQAASDAARAYGFTVCGSGVQKASVTLADGAKPALKKEWITKAEALCSAFSDKIDDLDTPTTASGIDAYSNAFIGAINDFTSGVKALPAPPGDEAAVAEIIASVEQLVPIFQDLVTAAKAGDRAEVAELQEQINEAGEASDAKSAAYGLSDCD